MKLTSPRNSPSEMRHSLSFSSSSNQYSNSPNSNHAQKLFSDEPISSAHAKSQNSALIRQILKKIELIQSKMILLEIGTNEKTSLISSLKSFSLSVSCYQEAEVAKFKQNTVNVWNNFREKLKEIMDMDSSEKTLQFIEHQLKMIEFAVNEIKSSSLSKKEKEQVDQIEEDFINLKNEKPFRLSHLKLFLTKLKSDEELSQNKNIHTYILQINQNVEQIAQYIKANKSTNQSKSQFQNAINAPVKEITDILHNLSEDDEEIKTSSPQPKQEVKLEKPKTKKKVKTFENIPVPVHTPAQRKSLFEEPRKVTKIGIFRSSKGKGK